MRIGMGMGIGAGGGVHYPSEDVSAGIVLPSIGFTGALTLGLPLSAAIAMPNVTLAMSVSNPPPFVSGIYSGNTLDLDAAVGYSGGTWTDQSGAGHNCAQATAGFRPAATTVGGFAALDFDGTDDRLQSVANASTIITVAAYTVFVVCYIDAISSNGTAIQNDGLVTCGSGFFGLVLKSGGSVAVAGNTPFIGATKAVATGAITLIACRYDGTTVKVSVDGTDGTGDAEANASFGTNKLDIGLSAQWSEFFDGKMLRVVAYNVSLSDADWAAAKAALKAQYGIT